MIIKFIGTISDEVTSHDDEPVIEFCKKKEITPDECLFQATGGVTHVYHILEK